MSTEVATGQVPEFTRGDRMRVALRHADVNVQEMATYLGVSRTAVSRWINDRGAPGKQTLRLWSLRCGVSLEWLETGQAPTDEPGPGESAEADSGGTPPGTRTLNPLNSRLVAVRALRDGRRAA